MRHNSPVVAAVSVHISPNKMSTSFQDLLQVIKFAQRNSESVLLPLSPPIFCPLPSTTLYLHDYFAFVSLYHGVETRCSRYGCCIHLLWLFTGVLYSHQYESWSSNCFHISKDTQLAKFLCMDDLDRRTCQFNYGHTLLVLYSWRD